MGQIEITLTDEQIGSMPSPATSRHMALYLALRHQLLSTEQIERALDADEFDSAFNESGSCLTVRWRQEGIA